MKRVIVTGASGFVGANLARRMIHDGHQTHLLVSPGTESWRLADLKGHAPQYPIDLIDADAVRRVVETIRPDWVFHLAAHGAYSWQTDVRRMVATNLMGTINLVEACLHTGFEACVNTGSSSEYGFKDHAPPEDEFVEPNSAYAVTKASATLYCRCVAQNQKVPITTLRLYSVFGPWEEPNRLIPTIILRGLKGELPPLVSPDTARDYIYVDDVLDAYVLAAQPGREPGLVLNVGTGVQTSVRQVVELARATMQITCPAVWGSMPNRVWDSDVWLAETGKIRQLLGWEPRHSFQSGFQQTVEWFRNTPGINRWYGESLKSE
jgi:UDP-glucose 4-epimerase